MSEHPIVGERILARTKELARLAPIVRHEHEHWDGTGYPGRAAARSGSRSARGSILACHAYVAMIDRASLPAGAHRGPGASPSCAPGAARKYDPDVVDALLDLLGQDRPQVPDRSAGVKLVAPSRRASPVSRRSSGPDWVPGG